MNKKILIEENDVYSEYEDDIGIYKVYKNGGQTSTRKHDISWHESAPSHLKDAPCKYCKKIKTVKKYDSTRSELRNNPFLREIPECYIKNEEAWIELEEQKPEEGQEVEFPANKERDGIIQGYYSEGCFWSSFDGYHEPKIWRTFQQL